MPMDFLLLRPLARFQAPTADPFATLVSTKSTGDISGSAQSDTGYIKVEWWDSTFNVYGTGVAGNNIIWSKAAGGAGSKTLRIIPSDASGNLSGSLTGLTCFANALTSLDVRGLTALTSLSCGDNSLTSLDVSGLTALGSISCFNNFLTSIDLSGLTALTSLQCGDNSLTSIDLSGLTALTSLVCADNSLTSLDVSGLTALTNLNCSGNSLTSLDVSDLTALTSLSCSGNSLTSLDLSALTALVGLLCKNNSLTSLDVSDSPALTNLDCSNNSLTSLRAFDVVFDVGKWKNKYKGKASGVQFINNNQLNAAALNQFYTDLGATTPGTGFLDVTNNPGSATADHTIATNKGYVVFAPPPPDPFATLVSTRSTGNISGAARSTTGYIKVEWWDSTSNVYGTGAAGSDISWSKAAGGAGSKTLRIYPSNSGGNLSGSLTDLRCNNNSLTSLEVSGLTALTALNCNDNSLTSLNASGCTALISLSCSSNSLTSLDVSGLTALVVLSCVINSLTSLDLSGLTALTSLFCNNNSLTSLRAVGVVFDAGKWKNKKKGKANGVQFVNNNQLNAAALNQFYTDLGATTPGTGFLDVRNNPGTATHDPTIATNKGYVVFDT